MSISLLLKSVATSIQGSLFRTNLITDMSTIETEANRVALALDPEHNANGTHKTVNATAVVAPSITLGGVLRNTWPASGSATVSLTDVLANGHVGNLPAGDPEAGINNAAGVELYRFSSTGEATDLAHIVPLRTLIGYFARANDIGKAGAPGFGVGICPALPAGFSKLPGTDFPQSDEYGNYQFTDGSIMVWIPAFYYKWTGTNIIDIQPEHAYATEALANADGYALHRAFYDGGAAQRGVFVDKYKCSNNSGTASSIKNGNPLSSAAANEPFNGLTGAPANALYGAIAAAKTRGADFFPGSLFIRNALALLSLAHAQASTSTTWCAWYNATYNFPKGCNNNALADQQDATVTFTWTGNATYTTTNKTGSANTLAKTTHNGQNSGVADLNGTIWEVALGLTSNGTNIYVLKTAAAMKDITASNTTATDAWGATGIAALYDDLGTTYEALWATGANRTTYFGNAGQVFSTATSGNAWNAAGAGVPLIGGVGGTNAFGSDVLADYKPNEMCPLVGGLWSGASNAGVWALYLNYARGYSGNAIGLRAALYL